MTSNQQAARELLPCPFCGTEAHMLEGGTGGSWFPYITCKNALCSVRIYGTGALRDLKRADAVQQWNRRPTTPDAGEKL